MAFRTVLLIIILVFCGCVFSCPAEEPENLSLFDPATFALPNPAFPDQENLTSFDRSSDGNVTTISGTGSVSKYIRLNSTTGDYTESSLNIEGTDETSWRYSLNSGNYSELYYTAIELEVTDATAVALLSRGTTLDGDVANSHFLGIGNVSGIFLTESLIPGTDPYSFLNGPYSQQITDSFTGDFGFVVDQGRRTGPGEAVDRIDSSDLIGYLAEQDISEENITTREAAFGDTDLESASITRMDTPSLADRYGQAVSEPDGVSSTQYVDDFSAGQMSLSVYSINTRSSTTHQVAGDTIDGPAYYGRAIASGDGVSARAEYDLSSDSQIFREMYAPFEDGKPGVHDLLQLISGAGATDAVHLTGDENLFTDDPTLSIEGAYDLSAPFITHTAEIQGGTTRSEQSLTAGGENGLPVSLKGYIRQYASPAHPMASLQSLFYADAKRGTPVQWNSNACRGDENVTATGSTTSGSGFIRQKAYADHSTLTAE